MFTNQNHGQFVEYKFQYVKNQIHNPRPLKQNSNQKKNRSVVRSGRKEERKQPQTQTKLAFIKDFCEKITEHNMPAYNEVKCIQPRGNQVFLVR